MDKPTSPPPDAAPLESRPTRELREHELVKLQPRWEDDDPRMHALIESVREGGVREPLRITRDGRIVDGRHRWRAAKALRLPEVPCREVPEDEAAEIVVSSLLHRRHYTPSQRAFVLAPILDIAFRKRAENRNQNLRKGQCSPETHSVRGAEAEGLEEWLKRAGISLRLLQQARELHQLFTDHPEPRDLITDRAGVSEENVAFRDFFTPRLLADEDPYALGAALTGCKTIIQLEYREANAARGLGRHHTGGKPKEQPRQLALFTETFTRDMVNRFEYWGGFAPEAKRTALHSISSAVERMPDDLLEALEQQLRAELRRRKRAAGSGEE